MTNEEKQLLLKDLCARLPYGVKCNALLKQIDGSLKSIFGIFKGYNGLATVGNNLVYIETVRPYLRPMSSMTKEEYNGLKKISDYYGFAPFKYMYDWGPNYDMIDWLNARHFDYRGLIGKGLALEAPENMYKNE